MAQGESFGVGYVTMQVRNRAYMYICRCLSGQKETISTPGWNIFRNKSNGISYHATIFDIASDSRDLAFMQYTTVHSMPEYGNNLVGECRLPSFSLSTSYLLLEYELQRSCPRTYSACTGSIGHPVAVPMQEQPIGSFHRLPRR